MVRVPRETGSLLRLDGSRGNYITQERDTLRLPTEAEARAFVRARYLDIVSIPEIKSLLTPKPKALKKAA